MPAIAQGATQNGAKFYWHLGDLPAIYDFDQGMQQDYKMKESLQPFWIKQCTGCARRSRKGPALIRRVKLGSLAETGRLRPSPRECAYCLPVISIAQIAAGRMYMDAR